MSQSPLTSFWGKYDSETGNYHALVHHCADVAACVEALLELPTIERSIAQSAGLKSLSTGQKSQLAAITFLHDLGKIAMGFQCQIWDPAPQNAPPRKGHIQPIFSCLFSGDDSDSWLSIALDVQDLVSWDDREGETVQELLAAALAHHRTPVNIDKLSSPRDYLRQWQALGALDPEKEAANFGHYLRLWFPLAFADRSAPLPSATAFQHAYAGLVSLADWIGSDFSFRAGIDEDYITVARNRAKIEIQNIGLDTGLQRSQFLSIPTPQQLFKFKALRPLQQSTFDAPINQNVLILEAETGAGKTEAALMRFAKLYHAGEVDSLYFAVPTRAAAVQLHRRVCEFTARLFEATDSPQPVLAVPGYLQANTSAGKRLPNFVVEWDDSPDQKMKSSRWAAEHHKRFLAAQIAVGTIDQVMLSAMPVKHAHLRATALSRSLLVIDELHASDNYMQEIIERVVKQHTSFGSHVLMMSATLTASARERWLTGKRQSNKPLSAAVEVVYPSLSYQLDESLVSQAIAKNEQQKEVTVSLCDTGDSEISSLAWQAANAGARVLIIRNTVKSATALLEQLQAHPHADAHKLFNINGVVTLHHSRFAAEDRKRLDAAVEMWLGKDRPAGGCIVVGTQTLEQSLDIDADLLITDLCPIDVLLQRIGRLHRHLRENRPVDYQTAKTVIVSPDQHDLSCLLERSELGLGPKSHVYSDIIALQATLNLISHQPQWKIPQMNRALVEGALHPSIRQQLLNKHGPDWQRAEQHRDGTDNADTQAARMHPLRTDCDFLSSDVRFPDKEIRLPTRLGGDSLLVTLEPAVSGPFAAPVANFNIPDWMLGEKKNEFEQAPQVSQVEGKTMLTFTEKTFSYTHLGLAVSEDHV